MTQIDHIGIAVRDLAEAAELYTQGLGLRMTHIECVPAQGVRVGFVPVGDLEIELLTNAEYRMRQDICLLAARNLAEVGVRATPRTIEWGSFLARLQAGDFEGAVNRWIEPTQIDLEDVWHTPPEGVPTSNYGGYSNPEVDTLIARAAEISDLNAQKPLFYEIQRLIVQDQPYTFLVEGRRLNALSRRVTGAELNDATPYFTLSEWRLEPAPR